VVPPAAVIVLLAAVGRTLSGPVVLLVGVVLAVAVLAAVHHAEVVAHRVGEPFGSLVLAVAVTVIEVALIVTLMVSGGPDKAALARDTVFAALMITCNGIIGMSLVVATMSRRVAVFNAAGTGAALAAIAALATLSLVLPTFTTSTPGPTFTGFQLAYAAVASIAVYGIYVFIQTIRHPDNFLPPIADDESATEGELDGHVATRGEAIISALLLVVALVSVVGLAKVESPAIESGVREARLPLSLVGVVIALLVLLPESLAAYRAARRGNLQTSMNLGYGSAMASIGLTIPAIALASLWVAGPLELGLRPVDMVLLALTVVVGILTVTPGRATLLQGSIHLAVFAGFLVLAVNP
jgi:Ca2+:H+ antiporter